MDDPVPQVISVEPVKKEGKTALKKPVKEHLGIKDEEPFLSMPGEVLLSRKQRPGSIAVSRQRHAVLLPPEAMGRLGLAEGSLLAMVQRGGRSVALKRLEGVERPAGEATAYDIEDTLTITRVLETNPMPDELLPRLRREYAKKKLKHKVARFLDGRSTLQAWQTRQALGISPSSDKALKKELIRQGLREQKPDGSWDGRVVLTARRLRELAVLGVSRRTEAVRKGVEWLLGQPESEVNPGMFFVAGRLVAKQAEVLAERRKGAPGLRFAARPPAELAQVREGDDTIIKACGPRIMWPNALALEGLLAQGCEADSRVQRALGSLLATGWCECSVHHGLKRGRRTDEDLDRFEQARIHDYTSGGTGGIDQVAMWTGRRVRPASCRSRKGTTTHALSMPLHIQPCELITTKCLYQVKDKRLRRLAEAHLWTFAGRCLRPAGGVGDGRYGLTTPGALDMFARYNHPAAKASIMRRIPWIVENQNKDGSWGSDEDKDTSTLAVVQALLSVREFLPAALRP